MTQEQMLRSIGQLCEYAVHEKDEAKKAQLIYVIKILIDSCVSGDYESRGPPEGRTE